jgi:hypothetical protein
MKWFFARNDGGQDGGFHNPGVETFKGNIDRYLARELIQNSLDARLDSQQPVRVEFEVLEVPRNAIPDMDRLKETFSSCVTFWKRSILQSEDKIFNSHSTVIRKEICLIGYHWSLEIHLHNAYSDTSESTTIEMAKEALEEVTKQIRLWDRQTPRSHYLVAFLSIACYVTSAWRMNFILNPFLAMRVAREKQGISRSRLLTRT